MTENSFFWKKIKKYAEEIVVDCKGVEGGVEGLGIMLRDGNGNLDIFQNCEIDQKGKETYEQSMKFLYHTLSNLNENSDFDEVKLAIEWYYRPIGYILNYKGKIDFQFAICELALAETARKNKDLEEVNYHISNLHFGFSNICLRCLKGL